MSHTTHKVAVLVSSGRHPITGVARASKGDVVALKLGQRISDMQNLCVIHAGRPDDPSLLHYQAAGAETIEVMSTGNEQSPSLEALAAELSGFDLILTGSRTETGLGSGLFPYVLAKCLNRPLVANVLDAKFAGQEVHVRQFLPKGKRRNLAVSLPAVLAIHPLATAKLTYAYSRKLPELIHVRRLAPEENPLTSVQRQTDSTETPYRRIVRLRAEAKQPGHLRLKSAITTEYQEGVVVIEGSHVDKAQVIVAYLREHRLIEF